MYIRPLVSPKRIILPLFYINAHIFGLLWNPSPDGSILVILEYTSSNCVKLLDCLSDLQELLINHISSEISSDILSQPVNSCFICICVHGFSVWTPSICRKGKLLKMKHWLLRKQLWRWRPLQNPIWTILLHSYAQKHTYNGSSPMMLWHAGTPLMTCSISCLCTG